MMRAAPGSGPSAVLRAALLGLLVLVGLGAGTTDAGLLPRVAAAEPAAQAACSPRPRVQVSVTNSDANTLSVVVSVSPTGSGPTNALQLIRFGAARNATIDVPGGPTGSAGSFDQAYPAGTTQATFVVRRAGGAMTVPFTVVDVCGNWPTFV